MINILEDMSTITTIPERSLRKFFRKMIYCMCEGVEETLAEGVDDISEFDIGIGILYIKHVGSEIKYHFQPSTFFEKSIAQTVENKANLLEDLLNDGLAKNFSQVYKDLC